MATPIALPPVLRVDALRTIEGRFAGEPLMERAGLAAAEIARAMLASRSGTVVVLAGPGNNGGDAFVVARWLREWFYDVAVVFPGDPGKLPRDAAEAHRRLMSTGATSTPTPPDGRPALVIDGLFGIGLGRPLAAPYPVLVEWANAQDAPILALDVPTGLDAETGIAREPAIRADATATFLALKPGLLTNAGVDLCGAISVHALGVDVESHEAPLGHALSWPALAASLPEVLLRRERNVHKGTFGTLAIIGGDSGLVGAPLLASRAAVKCGAGKVRVGFVAADFPSVDPVAPETMLRRALDVLAADADALVVGCGLGMADAGRQALAKALAVDVPAALDADALNLIAGDASLLALARKRSAPTLATPHPAEAARLLGTDVPAIQRDRLAAAQRLAQELGAHVVLKGAGSVLAHPDGTWDINTSGNAALATAGSGDVLAGMLGALLAQHIGPKQALRLAVCLHGAAADAMVARGVGPLGVSASDLCDSARDLVNRATAGRRAMR